MKKLWILLYVSFSCTLSAWAESPKVPEVVFFADMRLELTADARKKVQTDVDALTRYEKYFNAKVERIDTYFPLIEQVLQEENVPNDIKYLVIQESALVGDAVSSSNAVGYWQFKAPSAREVGLTINGSVDERMNIITATRGAARYFKNNNALFDNWLHALMAYYEGPGGALKKADKQFNGRKVMRLDGRAHWYILKYLSHKIAFEDAIGKDPNPSVQLFVYDEGAGQSLREIAEQFSVTEEDLKPYNHWLKQKRVPEDKVYPVIVPDFSGSLQQPPLADNSQPESQYSRQKEPSQVSATLAGETLNSQAFPGVKTRKWFGKKQLVVNGIPGVLAKEGEDVKRLAQRTGVSPSRLVKFNDLSHPQSSISPGQPYYIKAKRNRAPARYHIAEEGETWWSVSQRFGVKLKKLLRNNRLKAEKPLETYRVIWLRYIRPSTIPVEYRRPNNFSDTPQVANNQSVSEPAPADEYDASIDQSADVPDSEQAWRNTSNEDVASADETMSSSYHTVRSQETLHGIAKQYNITAAELAGYNQMSVYESLKVGQQLRIPVEEEPLTNDFHEVQPGETMYQIAQEYRISMRELMEWNQKENFNIQVGELLRINPPNR